MCIHKHICYNGCMLETRLHVYIPRGRENERRESVFLCECVYCGETLWSFLSLLITLRDHTTRCDSAQCSSASGAAILIDVKTTKYSLQWWVPCRERLREVTSTLQGCSQAGQLKQIQCYYWSSMNMKRLCWLEWKRWSSCDSYISISWKGFIAFSWNW